MMACMQQIPLINIKRFVTLSLVRVGICATPDVKEWTEFLGIILAEESLIEISLRLGRLIRVSQSHS
jgi:hypothetical protein